MKVPRDATIADVVQTLAKPEDYLRGVLGHQHECKRQYGVAPVRIGITGQGIIPHYRIEYPSEYAGTPWDGVFGAFRGDNHKPLADEEVLHDEHWSKKEMSFEEVQELLRMLRAEKRK